MKHFELKGQIREAGNKAVVKAFRKQGLVPCNLYGLGMENVLFTVSAKDLRNLINTPSSYIVDLSLSDGKTYCAVIHELQFHPVKDDCLHVDFLQVDEKKPIAITVPVAISGHPVGVQHGGKFVQSARKLRISALMKDLPDILPINVDKLDIEDKFVAGDLKMDNITVLTQKNTVVCTVVSTRQVAAAAASQASAEAEGSAEEGGEASE